MMVKKKRILYYLICALVITNLQNHYLNACSVQEALVEEGESQSTPSSKIIKDEGTHLYPEIHKINDDFYFAQMLYKPLWLGMERLTPANHALWLTYAEVQSNQTTVRILRQKFEEDKRAYSDGSAFFLEVIKKACFRDTEAWIAYVADQQPEPIPTYMRTYTPKDLNIYPRKSVPGQPFANAIKMYVTVTSSPSALITTHLGIETSRENLLHETPQRGMSLDLHSFAAKVMLRRNPQRLYMLNLPTLPMLKIIADALPKAVYVGTHGRFKELRKSFYMSFGDFKREKESGVIESLKNKASDYIESVQMGRRKIIEEELPNFSLKLSTDGQKLEICEDLLRSNCEANLKVDFEWTKRLANPLIPFGTKGGTIDLLDLMESHPPIIKRTGGHPSRDEGYIIKFFGSKEIILKFNQKDSTYRWLFLDHYNHLIKCEYLCTDLEALAKSKLLKE